jgi:hypothetical protein
MSNTKEPAAVFCGQCAWYRGQPETGGVCAHVHAWEWRTTALGVRQVQQTATDRNADNACGDYEPRSFWAGVWQTIGPWIGGVLTLWILLELFLWWSTP